MEREAPMDEDGEPMHTAEPWAVPAGIVLNQGVPFTPVVATTLIAKVYSTAFDDWEQSEANARRIVACVNACAGIPTWALETLPLGGLDAILATHDKMNEVAVDSPKPQ